MIWLLLGLLSIVLIFYRYTRRLILIAGLVGAVAIGNLRFGMNTNKPANDVSIHTGQTVQIEGVIIDDPQEIDELVKFILLAQEINGQSTSGRVLVTTRRYPPYHYGNVVLVQGRLSLPQPSSDFNYPAYLSRFGVYSTMDYPDTSIIKPFAGNFLLSWLYKTKGALIASISRTLSEPAASFLAGLLFGVRQSMPRDLLDDFNITGLTHIIALSGFNITIIAGALMGWFKFLPLRFKFGLTMIAIVSFVLLTGASPSVTRAAIMGIIILWAGLSGRIQDITVSLLMAAAAMALFNPRIINYDVGFQLSFLSTAGIIYLGPLFDRASPLWLGWVRGYLGPTLAALVFVMPLIAYNFGRVSLIAPVANVLVLPWIPLAMGLGFTAAVVGLIHGFIGGLVGLLAWVPLQIMTTISTFLARLPLASFEIPVVSLWWIIGYYLMLIGLTIYWYWHVGKKSNQALDSGRLGRS